MEEAMENTLSRLDVVATEPSISADVAWIPPKPSNRKSVVPTNSKAAARRSSERFSNKDMVPPESLGREVKIRRGGRLNLDLYMLSVRGRNNKMDRRRFS